MEKLTIYCTFKGNGILFGLIHKEHKELQALFPNALPARSIFIEYDMKSNFKEKETHLEKYVFPVIAGFPKTEDLQKIKKVEFVKTPENIVTFTINTEKNDEQQIQPVRR
jgi:hypothetical protein